MIGLGMIVVGLKMMDEAINDDSIKIPIYKILKKIQFPLLLEFFGILFNAIIQFNMINIVNVMVSSGKMNMRNDLFIIIGTNVGSCAINIIGIIGTNINSKRFVLILIIINITGCIIFTHILWFFNKPIINFLQILPTNIQIAAFYLFYNIFTALIAIALIKYFVKISKYIIKDEKNPDEFKKLLIEDEENIDIEEKDTNTDIDVGTPVDNNISNDNDPYKNELKKDNDRKDKKYNISTKILIENTNEEKKDEKRVKEKKTK